MGEKVNPSSAERRITVSAHNILSKEERYKRAQQNREVAAQGKLNMDLEAAVAGMDRQTQLMLIKSVRGANCDGTSDPDSYISPYSKGCRCNFEELLP